MTNLLTTTAAAIKLGVTPGRVRAMIAQGRLRAARAGRDWLIDPKVLAALGERKAGRPPSRPPRKSTGGA